uniref:NADH-ubiquinone oxidoreductase chain 2 n=1 Tax=Cleroidea sp. 1 KM-2017 TaxID=2219306 RepID=A0A346RG22_9CUCU|nr:NADH dehydrogenase subunit 2 [Cleroidea sp. 1 KM-2017]
MKFYKLMFFITMISGTLISICSYSWLGMWMGLEINLISIIPLINNNLNMYSTESSIKYFLTQTIASMFILFSIILMSMNMEMMFFLKNKILMIIMNSGLLTKMGAAPFHFWFPEVMEGLSWINCFIMLTWQKIAPMILIMYNIILNNFFFFIITGSMLISGILGLNQISMRKILTFSSINHIGWMLSAMIHSKIIWLINFIIYTLITINLIFIFNKFKIFFVNQMIFLLNNKFIMKMFFCMNFFSLGGLPPFLGFLPKWLIINEMIMNKNYFLSFLMIMLTLLTLYFYTRTIFSGMTMNLNSQMLMNFKILNNFYFLLFNFMNLSLLLIFPIWIISI